MTVWSTAGLGGLDNSAVELCGKIIGRKQSHWYFDDGVGKHWLPREYIQSYHMLGEGYCIVTIPQWLAKKRRFHLQKH